MSSSRPAGVGETWLARSISSSVVSPMAETTTTTWLPAFLVSTMRRATRLMLSASATEEPPYFCTTMPTAAHLVASWAGSRTDRRPRMRARTRSPRGRDACTQERFYRLLQPVPGRVQDSRRGLDLLVLALDVGVEAVVGDDRVQRSEHAAGVVAPRR